MGISHAHGGTSAIGHGGRWRSWLGFLQHLGEMILAMMLGMVLLGIAFGAVMAAIGYSHPFQQLPELSAVVMTLNMAAPMAAWMRIRGHTWERAGEMAGAMILPAVALLVLCVVGVIASSNLAAAVMVATLPAMAGVMLYRRADYLHHGTPKRTDLSES